MCRAPRIRKPVRRGFAYALVVGALVILGIIGLILAVLGLATRRSGPPPGA